MAGAHQHASANDSGADEDRWKRHLRGLVEYALGVRVGFDRDRRVRRCVARERLEQPCRVTDPAALGPAIRSACSFSAITPPPSDCVSRYGSSGDGRE